MDCNLLSGKKKAYDTGMRYPFASPTPMKTKGLSPHPSPRPLPRSPRHVSRSPGASPRPSPAPSKKIYVEPSPGVVKRELVKESHKGLEGPSQKSSGKSPAVLPLHGPLNIKSNEEKIARRDCRCIEREDGSIEIEVDASS